MPNQNSVGGVSVSVRLDDKEAVSQLNKLRQKINSLNESLNQKRAKRSEIEDQMRVAGAEADHTRYEVKRLKEALKSAKPSEKADIREQLTEANAEYRDYQRTVNSLNDKYVKLGEEITNGETSLQSMTESAAGLEKQVAASTGTMAKLQTAAGKAAKKMAAAFARVGRMIRKVFVFTLILRALQAFREYLNSALMSTPEFAEALGELKGALLTLVQPLMGVVIPALTRFLQILARVATAIGQLVSKLFGMTYQQSQAAAQALNEQADAYKNAGSAAGKASKQLASFDQLNVLSDSGSAGGSGASVATGADAKPIFGAKEEDESFLRRVLTLVEAIGAAILGWNLGQALRLGLADTLSLMLAIAGAAVAVQGYMEAWEDGIDWGSLLKIVAGLAAAVGGLALAFGSTAAGIAALVGGIALIVLAVKDMIENGLTLQNVIALLLGVGAAALGLGLLFGPVAAGLALAIGGIAAAILGVVDAWKNGLTWKDMILILGGVAAAAVGLALAFGPVAAGIELVAAGAAMLVLGIKDVMENGLNLKNGLLVIAGIIATGLGISLLVGGSIPALIAGIVAVVTALTMVGGTFEEIIESVKLLLSGFVKFFKGVFTGDFELALEGFKDIFRGFVNTLLGIFGGIVNAIVKGLNFIFEKLNEMTKFTVPEWIPGIGGQTWGLNLRPINEWDIPYLARGAVIPPNREFMAVLGDQRSGTNIEAPLDTIVQAMLTALGDSGMTDAIVQMGNLIIAAINGKSTDIYLNGRRVAQEIYEPLQEVSRNRGTSLVREVR